MKSEQEITDEINQISKDYDEKNEKLDRANAIIERKGKDDIHKRDFRRLGRAFDEGVEIAARHRKWLNENEERAREAGLDESFERSKEGYEMAAAQIENTIESFEKNGQRDLAESAREKFQGQE